MNDDEVKVKRNDGYLKSVKVKMQSLGQNIKEYEESVDVFIKDKKLDINIPFHTMPIVPKYEVDDYDKAIGQYNVVNEHPYLAQEADSEHYGMNGFDSRVLFYFDTPATAIGEIALLPHSITGIDLGEGSVDYGSEVTMPSNVQSVNPDIMIRKMLQIQEEGGTLGYAIARALLLYYAQLDHLSFSIVADEGFIDEIKPDDRVSYDLVGRFVTSPSFITKSDHLVRKVTINRENGRVKLDLWSKGGV